MTSRCTVPTCRRAAPDAFVCRRCGDEFVTALTEYPATGRDVAGMTALVTDLELAVGRESRLAAAGGAQADDGRPMGFGYPASEAAWNLSNTLGTWVRELCEDRGVPLPMVLIDVSVWPRENCRRSLSQPSQVVACASFLARHVEAARQSAGGGQLVDEVRSAVHQARSAVDRPAGRVFCGRCTNCGTTDEPGPELLADPGASEVPCPSCGWTYRVASRQDALLDQVRGSLGTASEIAGLLGELFGIRVSLQLISTWKSRGRLVVRGDRSGHSLYRIGDVIDLAQWSAPRQGTRV